MNKISTSFANRIGTQLGFIIAVTRTETKKAIRSKLFWITLIGMVLVPLMLSVLMYIKKYPELTNNSILTTKASMIPGNADWPTYISLCAQILVGTGMFAFAFVVSWLFGREHTDRTLKDLLALPLPRWSFVTGKFVVMVIWCILLFFVSATAALVAGALLHLDNWSSAFAVRSLQDFTAGIAMAIWLNMLIALVAAWSGGYLAAIGAAVVALLLGNFIEMLGLGYYYPWYITMAYASDGLQGIYPGAVSIIIVIVSGLAGFAGTIFCWRYADQT
ncbi:MAG: hypothetical protein CVU50_05550 [Candidatus Cloacimonetes bacterium HGW-Cloacimonetes-3]|jgi:ABC-2 type transport system permease protein|nr:MAG: hypothetical protein CVU50_05550 [Candidatus Cloacimonetes bacterium HGW-Cloacimonetes-3]